MHFLRLVGSGHLSSANRPDWLVGNDNVLPAELLFLQLLFDCLHLRLADSERLVGLPLREQLPDAKDNLESHLQSKGHLSCHGLIALSQNVSSFRVSEYNPRHLHINEVIRRNFSGKGAKVLRRAILSSNLNLLLQKRLNNRNVQKHRRYDHFDFRRIELHFVEHISHQLFRGRQTVVAFPISSYYYLSLHFPLFNSFIFFLFKIFIFALSSFK